MDASNIQYTGLPYTNLPGIVNNDLTSIIGIISVAINTSSAAPDYSGYDLACVTQTGGGHPTNTQNFAEGISKILCDLKTAYTTFSGTTYPAAISTLTTAVTNLQTPALTYVPFSITNTDTVTQVWTKVFAGLTAITASIVPTTANWSSLGLSNQTTIVTAFNAIIAYLVAQDATISGKQTSLGTFNTTSIGGGSGTSPITSITQLITYAASLPPFDAGDISSSCVATGADLQETVQNTINQVEMLSTNTVRTQGTGIVFTGSGCGGKTANIDTTWTGLYKVMSNSSDTDPGYLDSKIVSSDNSLTIATSGSAIDIRITTPGDVKVKASSVDTSGGYLIDKVVGVPNDDWGISISTGLNTDGTKVTFQPTIIGGAWGQAFMNYVASDPTLLTQFANLVSISGTIPGPSITDLVVTLTTGDFVFSWTALSGNSQQAKWRQKGDVTWNTGSLTPANPLSSVAVTTTLAGFTDNTPYQCQVDTIYNTGLIGSNVYEIIKYVCQSLSTHVASGVISVSQPALVTDGTIEYQLWNSGPTMIQAITRAASAPNILFTAVGSGNYTVKWRYATTLNGVTLYSDDASQLGAYCVSGTIIVP